MKMTFVVDRSVPKQLRDIKKRTRIPIGEQARMALAAWVESQKPTAVQNQESSAGTAA